MGIVPTLIFFKGILSRTFANNRIAHSASLTSYVPQFHSTVPVSQAMHPNSIPQCQSHKLCTPIPFHSASLTSYAPQFHSTAPVSQAMHPNSIPQCQSHKLCIPIPFHSASLTSYVPQFHSTVPISQAMYPNSIPQCQSQSWLVRLGLGTYPILCRGPQHF